WKLDLHLVRFLRAGLSGYAMGQPQVARGSPRRASVVAAAGPDPGPRVHAATARGVCRALRVVRQARDEVRVSKGRSYDQDERRGPRTDARYATPSDGRRSIERSRGGSLSPQRSSRIPGSRRPTRRHTEVLRARVHHFRDLLLCTRAPVVSWPWKEDEAP